MKDVVECTFWIAFDLSQGRVCGTKFLKIAMTIELLPVRKCTPQNI